MLATSKTNSRSSLRGTQERIKKEADVENTDTSVDIKSTDSIKSTEESSETEDPDLVVNVFIYKVGQNEVPSKTKVVKFKPDIEWKFCRYAISTLGGVDYIDSIKFRAKANSSYGDTLVPILYDNIWEDCKKMRDKKTNSVCLHVFLGEEDAEEVKMETPKEISNKIKVHLYEGYSKNKLIESVEFDIDKFEKKIKNYLKSNYKHSKIFYQKLAVTKNPLLSKKKSVVPEYQYVIVKKGEWNVIAKKGVCEKNLDIFLEK